MPDLWGPPSAAEISAAESENARLSKRVKELEAQNAELSGKIGQLEADNKLLQDAVDQWELVAASPGAVEDMARENTELLEKVEQLQAERDAAVADIEDSQPCFACKHFKRNGGNCGGGKRCLRLAEIAENNGGTYRGKFFEWRGVTKEE